MHYQTLAVFAEVWVRMVRVLSGTFVSERSDGATDEVMAFV